MVESNATKVTSDDLPSKPIILALKVHANKNITNVRFQDFFNNGTMSSKTSVSSSISPDGKLTTNGNNNIAVEMDPEQVTIPMNTAITDLPSKLKTGQETVYKNDDGSWVAAINLGTLGTADAIKQKSGFYERIMMNNPWQADDTKAKALDALMIDSSNPTHGSVFGWDFNIAADYADQTIVDDYTTADFYNSIDGNSLADVSSTVKAKNTVTDASSNGQSIVKYHFVDEKGNDLVSIKTNAGWGPNNDDNHPVDKFDYTAPTTLTDANGVHYHLEADKSDGNGHVTGDFPTADKPGSYNFVYAPDAGKPVTVNYKTDDGTKLSDSITLDAKPEGTDYTTDAKKFAGYTLTKTPTNATGKYSDKEQTVDYIYKADAQKMKVSYVDDDNKGATVGTADTLSGVSNQKADYTLKVPKGYDVTSVKFGGDYGFYTAGAKSLSFTYDTDVDTDQTTVIHLTHHTKAQYALTTHDTVHYLVDGKADDRVKDVVKDTKWDTDLDEVTKVTTYTPDAKSVTVDSPALKGYDVDKKNVSFTSSAGTTKPMDQEQTVKYTSQNQKAVVKYVDDDNNSSVVKTDNLTGKSEASETYDVDIPKGYDFSKTTFDSGTTGSYKDGKVAFTYDTDQDKDQVITVHLSHHHTKVQDAITTQNDVHYTIAGKVSDQLKDTFKAVSWLSDTDEVTNKVTYTPDDKSQTVDSPSLAGYTASDKSVSFTMAVQNDKPVDQKKTVDYTADGQKVTIQYIDHDDDDKVVATDHATGTSDEESSYKVEVPKGYDYKDIKFDDQTKGTLKDQVVSFGYDHDEKDQVITIGLTHHHTKVTDAITTHDTVKYTVDGEASKELKDKVTEIKWDTDTDEVTHDTTYTPEGTDITVTSPVMEGMTPDQKSVTFTLTSLTKKPVDETQVVNYLLGKSETIIKYMDDRTNKQVGKNVVMIDKINSKQTYTVKVPTGYKFVRVEKDKGLTRNVMNLAWEMGKDVNTITIHLTK